MAVSREAKYIDGIWGPYYSAMIPTMWLTEGGQSASGSLIDHIIFSHPQYEFIKQRADSELKNIYQILNEHLDQLFEKRRNHDHIKFLAALSRDYHVLDFFHGNRSPLADPTLKGTQHNTHNIHNSTLTR